MSNNKELAYRSVLKDDDCEIELLEQYIEEMRTKLHQLINQQTSYTINEEVLKVSRVLDELINQYLYSLRQNKSNARKDEN